VQHEGCDRIPAPAWEIGGQETNSAGLAGEFSGRIGHFAALRRQPTPFRIL
jgi:hypothetical protein